MRFKHVFQRWSIVVIRPRDFLVRLSHFIIIGVPVSIFVTMIYYLPEHCKEGLTFNPLAPNISDAFLSHYVHRDYDHFINNLTFFIIVFLLISVLEENKTRLYLVSLFNFFAVPLALSFFYLIKDIYMFKRHEVALGFSGIVSAFLGYMIILFSSNISNIIEGETSHKLRGFILLEIFTLSAFILFLRFLTICSGKPCYYGYLGSLALLACLVYLIIANRETVMTLIRHVIIKIRYIRTEGRSKGLYNYVLYFAYYLVIYGFPFSLSLFSLTLLILPNGITQEIRKVNILAHMEGFCLGMFMAFIAPSIVGKVSRFFKIVHKAQ